VRVGKSEHVRAVSRSASCAVVAMRSRVNGEAGGKASALPPDGSRPISVKAVATAPEPYEKRSSRAPISEEAFALTSESRFM